MMSQDDPSLILTILLPAHRNDGLFFQALESVHQALPIQSEILVIDTTSDSSIRISPQLSNTRVLTLPDSEYIQALEYGLRNSDSQFIALMNSDDLVHPERFHKQLDLILNTNSDLVLCGMAKFVGEMKPIRSLMGNISYTNYDPAFLLFGSYGANATWLFSKSWANRVNMFKDPRDRSDWETALRLFRDARIASMDDILYFYRQHNHQITRTRINISSEFYELWCNLNFTYGLPHLSSEEVCFLSAPYLGNARIKTLANLINWYSAFSHLKPFSATEMGLECLELFKIRMSIARIRNLSAKPLFFGYGRVLSVLITWFTNNIFRLVFGSNKVQGIPRV